MGLGRAVCACCCCSYASMSSVWQWKKLLHVWIERQIWFVHMSCLISWYKQFVMQPLWIQKSNVSSLDVKLNASLWVCSFEIIIAMLVCSFSRTKNASLRFWYRSLQPFDEYKQFGEKYKIRNIWATLARFFWVQTNNSNKNTIAPHQKNYFRLKWTFQPFRTQMCFNAFAILIQTYGKGSKPELTMMIINSC